VLEAVMKGGWTGYALQHTSEKLKGDEEVVLKAVTQDGRARQHASEELKGNREVVLDGAF
jgi:hypothetical protein